MILYHGSINKIEYPVFGEGAITNDYGRGFYCTEDAELAKEWACLKGTDGYANKYELDLSNLKIMDLDGSGYHIMNWLALLAKYRSCWEKGTISEEAKEYVKQNFLPDIADFDIIRGYRADDSYFSFAKSFVANGISWEQLKKAVHHGNLGIQIVLKSKKAFEKIRFVEAIPASKETYAEQAKKRDRDARMAYRKMVREESHKDELFMTDIMRRGMRNGDFL